MVNYRPYKNAEEFLQAWKEHGPFFRMKNVAGYHSVNGFNDETVSYCYWSGDKLNFSRRYYDDFLEEAVWIDGTLCGITENGGTCMEIINKALAQINNCGSLYTIEDVKFGEPFENTPCYLISSKGDAYLGGFEDGQFKVAHFTRREGHEGDVKWRQRIYYTFTTDVVAYIPYDIQ